MIQVLHWKSPCEFDFTPEKYTTLIEHKGIFGFETFKSYISTIIPHGACLLSIH